MDIKSQFREELAPKFRQLGLEGYRVHQVLRWLYEKRAATWEGMTDLSLKARKLLSESFALRPLEMVRLQGATDTTRKFLWRLSDGALIESVLIPSSPALYGDPSDRHTLCISTQVGCAYGCKFCASGLDGWKRNLEAHEIVEQVIAVERWHAAERAKTENERTTDVRADIGPRNRPLPRDYRLINNLVIMGMGEPLANYDALIRALRILNAPWGGNVGARKITISTSGLAPQIRQLADEPQQFRLAVSLHGATDETRNRIMPVNKKYPVEALAEACEYYQEKKNRMLTLEYILIAGVNDDLDETMPLAELAHRLRAKINLIPYNHVEGLKWERPTERAQEAFVAALQKHGATVTLRREKGVDIDAACGQLRLRAEAEAKAALKP